MIKFAHDRTILQHMKDRFLAETQINYQIRKRKIITNIN
jgi:hypothetical protein